MKNHPKIENAPGLVWKPRKIGWEARWQGRTDLVNDGYRPRSCRLWSGSESELTDIAISFIQDRCKSMQSDMLTWGRQGDAPMSVDFDGSVDSLIACYKSDPASTFGKLRYVTRVHYISLMNRLSDDCGTTLVKDMKARHVIVLYGGWIKPNEDGQPEKLAMGHAMVGMLRTLTNFGASVLEHEECERVANMLHRKKFAQGKPRTDVLTFDQVAAIRKLARAKGRASIALAQAIQCDFTWRQKDVIGEWVPVSEPGLSDVVSANKKWLRGIRWEEIDQHGTVKHITSKKLKEIIIHIKHAPQVVAELMVDYPGSFIEREVVNPLTGAVTIVLDFYRDKLPAKGPVVKSERFGIPYENTDFRREWRLLATECGVPNNVRNMDTRAGAITEAFQSGARPDAIQKTATHANPAMTGRYNRRDEEDIAEVMQVRAANPARNKPGN